MNPREELEYVDEVRDQAALRETALKQKIAARHSKKVIKREFEVGDLVLRRNQKDSEEGKLVANWDGPYRIRMKTGTGVTDSKISTKTQFQGLGMQKNSKILHLDGRQCQFTLVYILSSMQQTLRSQTSK